MTTNILGHLRIAIIRQNQEAIELCNYVLANLLAEKYLTCRGAAVKRKLQNRVAKLERENYKLRFC